MKFDDLDAKMRVFETAHDHCVLPSRKRRTRRRAKAVTAQRRKLHVDRELPMRDAYDAFIFRLAAGLEA